MSEISTLQPHGDARPLSSARPSDTNADNAVVATGLSKRYPAGDGVFDLTFEVQPGTVLGFIGPDGSGKSTALALIATVLTPTAGQLRVAQVDARRDPRRARRHVGYLGPDARLDPDETILENLRLHAILQRVDKRELTATVDGVIELFELGSVARSRFSELAHGQRRRAQMAAAFVHDPDVLVLDEPFAGVDVRTRNEVRELIRELAALGNTVVLATDHVELLEGLCDAVALLETGRIVSWGSPGDVARAADRGGTRRMRVRFGDGAVEEFSVGGADELRALLHRLAVDDRALVELTEVVPRLHDVVAGNRSEPPPEGRDVR